MSFLAWKFVSSYLGCFWLSILCWIFIVPIVLYAFFHGVYNFGPWHCQRSFIDILFNPVPEIEFGGCTTESNDFDLLKHQRFNHNLTAQQIARNAFLSAKRMTQSSVALVYNCPMANMSPVAPKLHGYQIYATFHNTSMEHQVIDSEKSSQTVTILTKNLPNALIHSITKPNCVPSLTNATCSHFLLPACRRTIICTSQMPGCWPPMSARIQNYWPPGLVRMDTLCLTRIEAMTGPIVLQL